MLIVRKRTGKSATHKLLERHLVEGTLCHGEENAFRVDQALMQDATGTMACMQYEELRNGKVKVPFAIVYVDHNMLGIDYRNLDDHRFLRTFAGTHGIHFSEPGNGICHQVHFERFAKPGIFLVGSDSHTPTAGAMGCLAIGAGGLDVAAVLAGYSFELETPEIVAVRLEGALPPWVESKDIILEMLRRLTVKGGVGKIYEFCGPGLKTLGATERATIANMITELGATSAVFPADERVYEFLRQQDRPWDFRQLIADENAAYDDEMVVQLDELEPLIACPSSPDNVVPVREVAGTPVAQVCIGSSVNSWYDNLALPAAVLRGGRVADGVEMTVSPGSRQILLTIVRDGVYADLVRAGAEMLLPACGPCVGMGKAPPSGAPSVRTFNRNFPGRSGTQNDLVYLASPATAAATALRGVITDPRELGRTPPVQYPRFIINDSLIRKPKTGVARRALTVIRGPGIKPPPRKSPLPESLQGSVLIVLPDNISTGSISPDGAIVMGLRSDIEAIAQYTFVKEDPGFPARAKAAGGGCIVAGENYGQGSSREHAALAPSYLGVYAVCARSFGRIHRRNLIEQGVLPVLIGEDAYALAKEGNTWSLPHVREELADERSGGSLTLRIGGTRYGSSHNLSTREREIVRAGGLLNYLKEKQKVRQKK